MTSQPPPSTEARASHKVIKRSLVVAGHATSVSLEEPFWRELRHLADRRGLTVPALVAQIDGRRGAANLSSALRVEVIEALRHEVSGLEAAQLTSAGAL